MRRGRAMGGMTVVGMRVSGEMEMEGEREMSGGVDEQPRMERLGCHYTAGGQDGILHMHRGYTYTVAVLHM